LPDSDGDPARAVGARPHPLARFIRWIRSDDGEEAVAMSDRVVTRAHASKESEDSEAPEETGGFLGFLDSLDGD
jgi:hypothetical protein